MENESVLKVNELWSHEENLMHTVNERSHSQYIHAVFNSIKITEWQMCETVERLITLGSHEAKRGMISTAQRILSGVKYFV